MEFSLHCGCVCIMRQKEIILRCFHQVSITLSSVFTINHELSALYVLYWERFFCIVPIWWASLFISPFPPIAVTGSGCPVVPHFEEFSFAWWCPHIVSNNCYTDAIVTLNLTWAYCKPQEEIVQKLVDILENGGLQQVEERVKLAILQKE